MTPANEAIRAENVSASEVGALMADHPYSTPEAIWDRLCIGPTAVASGLGVLVTGYTSEHVTVRVTSEAMENGTFMEAAILRLAEKRLGFRARANKRTFTHKTVRLCATPDAFVIGQPPGLVEIKLSGSREMWSRNDPPEHVLWQVRAQLACTGRETAAICVLIGSGLRTYLVERDRAEEDRMLAEVDRFWREHVVTGIRPEPRPPTPIEYQGVRSA